MSLSSLQLLCCCYLCWLIVVAVLSLPFAVATIVSGTGYLVCNDSFEPSEFLHAYILARATIANE